MVLTIVELPLEIASNVGDESPKLVWDSSKIGDELNNVSDHVRWS